MGKNELTHINGSVLRTLNVISGGKCSISGLEYVFSGINHGNLIDSLEYLTKSNYIELENHEKDRFSATNAVLTDKGIRILRGFLIDDCIEV
ncbi:MAG: hypothetical protein HDT23_03805 [Ruminococcus sp.]|nr:hypothetical protein [Ruminococcus sp.]